MGGIPEWWPYQAEFPKWYVWQFGPILYARKLRTSPPVVVHATTVWDLRLAIKQAIIDRGLDAEY